MALSVKNMLGGSSSAFFPSVFATGVSQSDDVKLFKMEKGNPHGVPSEYQEVEYIESTGTQYINTDYLLKVNDVVEFRIKDKTSTNAWLFGSDTNGNTGRFGMCGETVVNAIFNVDSWTATLPVASDSTIVYSLETPQYFSINGTRITANNSMINATLPLTVFADNRNGNRVTPSAMKLFYFTITNGGVKTLELIPCYRNSDNAIGMYDTVSNTFYTNGGTGTFTKGDDTSVPIKEMTGKWASKSTQDDAIIPTSDGTSYANHETAGYEHAKAFDGDMSTACYNHASGAEEWYVRYDLGSVYNITSVSYNIGSPTSNTSLQLPCYIQLSENGTTWETVATETVQRGTNEPNKTIDIAPTNARYVRVHMPSIVYNAQSYEYVSAMVYELNVGALMPTNGYLFKLNELGMYRVNATSIKGIEFTQDVLVDYPLEYVVPVSYRVYLLDGNNQYTDVTGGYTGDGYRYSNTYNWQKYTTDSNGIATSASATASYVKGIGSANTIDFTEYSKLCIETDFTAFKNDGSTEYCDYNFLTTQKSPALSGAVKLLRSKGKTGVNVNEFDISDVNGAYYLFFSTFATAYYYCTGHITRVWLE